MRTVNIGHPQGRIALHLNEQGARDLAAMLGPDDIAHDELLSAIERAYPTPLYCSACGRDLHGYRGPLCRYCDLKAQAT